MQNVNLCNYTYKNVNSYNKLGIKIKIYTKGGKRSEKQNKYNNWNFDNYYITNVGCLLNICNAINHKWNS